MNLRNTDLSDKQFLLISTCVYLVLSAGRSISSFLLKSPDLFLPQPPDFRCFEVERSPWAIQTKLPSNTPLYSCLLCLRLDLISSPDYATLETDHSN